MKRRILSGILTIIIMLMTVGGTVVYAAGEIQDTPLPEAEMQTGGAEVQDAMPEASAEMTAAPEPTEGVTMAVNDNSVISPSPTMPAFAMPQTTAQADGTLMPEQPPEPSAAYGSSLGIDPDKEDTYGVVIVEQKDGQWVVAQEHYYKSHLWFILLIVVAVIVAILIFILGIFLVDRFRG